MHPRHAWLHHDDDRSHRDHRRIRGAAVQHARPRRRLARQSRACQALVGTAKKPAAARGDPRGQHAADRPTKPHTPPDARGQFRDAPALGFPPQHACAELELLSGRIRRPGRDQGHADRARGARYLDDRRGHPRLCGDLLRDDRARGRRLQSVAAAAVPRLAGVLCRLGLVFRAALGRGRQVAGGCAIDDDGAHHRRVHQHRNRQIVLAHAARERLCAQRDGGVSADRLPANAHGHGVRSRQSRAQHGLDRLHGRHDPVAVDARVARRRRGRRCDRDGTAAQRHLALGHVGNRLAVRAGRYRAGRHEHARKSANHRRPARRRATACDPRRHPIRGGQLHLWRGARPAPAGDRPLESAHSSRRENRPGRPLGRRQEHDRQSAAAFL